MLSSTGQLPYFLGLLIAFVVTLSTSPDSILFALYGFRETPYAKRSLPSLQLSRECRAEVQRILHQRAMDVKLDPALQDKCMIDLGKWCSEKTETGQVLYTVTLLIHLQSWRGRKGKKGDKGTSCC